MAHTDLSLARWYFDESVLGAGKLLHENRDDVVFPGHPLLPELPLGSDDTDWIPIVAASGWVALCRDRRIRSRPAELAIAREAGLRMVWFAGKKDMRPAAYADLFALNLQRLERLVIKHGDGPWAFSLATNGLKPLHL